MPLLPGLDGLAAAAVRPSCIPVAQEKVAPVAQQVAGKVKENVREPAQQAVESVQSTGQDAGQTIAEQGRSAAQDVRDVPDLTVLPTGAKKCADTATADSQSARTRQRRCTRKHGG